jgi:leucyl aminopeptidase
MELKLNKIDTLTADANILIIASSTDSLKKYDLSKDELDFVNKCLEDKNNLIQLNQYKRWIFVQVLPEKKSGNDLVEALRREASKLKSILNKYKIKKLVLVDSLDFTDYLLAYAEGIILSHYTFLKYFDKKEEKANSLTELSVYSQNIQTQSLDNLSIVCESVYQSRRLVNEPLSYLNTKKLSEEIIELSFQSGFAVEVLGKKQIESLNMGGLLAVNQGSANPPSFSILSWKPENAGNKNPIVLIGKGIVFDTGGLSLKPTSDSMDYMKCDMAGAAVVATTIAAVARLKLPVYLVGLIPATENAIGNTAYVPGDVIHMHNKKTVEVLNTDAEGRLILADALSYASKYKPELVIDLATLTGAAAYAIGHYAMVVEGNASDEVFSKLQFSSEKTNERMVRLPLWEDYMELLKSDIADIKNVGGRVAGAITAGKFLEFFTDYPWIHFDIAGPAWVQKDFHYLTRGGTGFGVRLLVDFISNCK